MNFMAGSTPLQFDIPSLECDACAESVTKAVHGVDPKASVAVDLATKRVVIGGRGEPHEFIRALQAAGFEVRAAS